MRAMLVTVAALALGAPAFAQDAPSETASEASSSTEAETPAEEAPARTGFDDANALDLDADGGFVIIGKEHLPDFTVLIDREDLSKAYDLDLDERFLPKIIEAVGEEPF